MPDARLPRITVNDVPVDLKKAYQKWCVDQGVSMSEPLRQCIEWIVASSWDVETIYLIMSFDPAEQGLQMDEEA